MAYVLYIGPKPPPVSGYANIVHSLSCCLRMLDVNIKYLSSTPRFLTALYPGRIWKFIKLLYILLLFPLIFFYLFKCRILYININGGYAIIYDLLIVAIARISYKRIILHHNSYSYINRKSYLANILFGVSGSKSIHIVNCVDMQEKLYQYPTVSSVEIISNLAIMSYENGDFFNCNLINPPSLSRKSIPKKLVIGYMGYINSEKGVDKFCLTVESLYQIGIDVSGIAVGPVYDVNLAKELMGKYSGLIDFKPPLYGSDRDEFFCSIDVLLFPSRYLIEAEPLTIHHSLSHGVPVISTDVGCIKCILKNFDGCRSVPVNSFVTGAVSYISTDLLHLFNKIPNFRQHLISQHKIYAEKSKEQFYKVIERILVN